MDCLCVDLGFLKSIYGRRLTIAWQSTSSRMRVSHETASSSTECSRDKPAFSFVRGQDLTMWDIVWVSPQGHRSVSVSRHFLLQARSVPVPCENGSAETTVALGGRNPVAGLWGRTLGENCPLEPTFSYGSIVCDVNWLQVQPQRFPGCQSQQWWAKDIRLDWPTVMFDFLHQLVSGSLPS